jgi:hypothetical protein
MALQSNADLRLLNGLLTVSCFSACFQHKVLYDPNPLINFCNYAKDLTFFILIHNARNAVHLLRTTSFRFTDVKNVRMFIFATNSQYFWRTIYSMLITLESRSSACKPRIRTNGRPTRNTNLRAW